MASALSRLFTQYQDDDWVAKAIDGVYASESQERWGSPTLEVHPSSAGSVCPRDVQIGMLGYRGKVEPKSRRRMDNGTWAQRRWEAYLKDAGILDRAGVRLKYQDTWSGELDVLVQHPRTGKLLILEIKTMNARRWHGIPPQDADHALMARRLEQVERAYTYQLTHYFVYFRQHPDFANHLADECAFLFENTDTQEFHVRYMRPDADLIKRAFAVSSKAREALVNNQLLDPPFKRLSQTCRKCYRESVCYKLQDAEPAHTDAVAWAFTELEQGAIARVKQQRLADEQLDSPAGRLVATGSAGTAGGSDAEDGLLGWLDGPGSGPVAG